MAEIAVAKVKVELHRRARPEAVNALAESIGEIGLLNPILLDDRDRLISGLHRLEAHKKLGAKMIEFRRSDLDALGQELARIDENLCRNQMTALERAEALADRKELWERMHPETRHGGAAGRPGGGKKKAKDATVAGFAKATADKTGDSERSIQRHTQVAKGLDVEAKMVLREIPAAKSPGITELEQLNRLGPDKQREVAKQVAKTGETVKSAARSLQRAQQVAQVRVYRPPAGEYGVIVVDFPWRYDDTLDGSDASRGGTPYPTMSIEEIAAYPIPVAEDCAVFLWITNSHLIDPEAYGVVARAWRERYGLVPKQIRTWVKTRMGLGRVWRNITEHLVRFERGAPVYCPATQTTMFMAAAGEHSAKPDLAYAEIEALCASPSRLDMFARAERKGWITSGAELPRKPSGRAERDAAELEAGRAELKKEPAAPAPAPRKRRLTIEDRP